MLAYHNDIFIKDNILAELAAHRAADRLVQGYSYWNGSKGCAVGCTIRSGDHMEYETRFGIPVVLARLEDCIFEGLPVVGLANQWPERFMTSIKSGSDLSRVGWRFLQWLLTDASANPGIDHESARDQVLQCATIVAKRAKGDPLTPGVLPFRCVALISGSTSWYSVRSAENAARAALDIDDMDSADYAAESAISAAYSSYNAGYERVKSGYVYSGNVAAEHAWCLMSDKLISLIESCT